MKNFFFLIVLILVIILVAVYLFWNSSKDKFENIEPETNLPVVYNTDVKKWKTDFMPSDLYEDNLRGKRGLAFPH